METPENFETHFRHYQYSEICTVDSCVQFQIKRLGHMIPRLVMLCRKSMICVMWRRIMATHSSTLAWKMPRMEEPGRLQSMGLQRVGHNLVTSLSLSFILFSVLGL